MTLEYTIAAIPTTYKGRRYRSRLEAKWAAFFDLCGWSFEYEPYDLGEWSPDFLIKGEHSPILVEVKPITEIDNDVTEKMSRAAKLANFEGELLLVGVTPLMGCSHYSDHPFLGWLAENNYDYGEQTNERGWWFDSDPAPFAWYADRPDQIDFCSFSGTFRGRVTGLYDGGSWGDAFYGDHVRRQRIDYIWSRASSLVQWKKS